MRPILDKEYQKFFFRRDVPFDAFKAIEALANIQNLASTSTPVNMPVNMFRLLLSPSLGPHPDDPTGATGRGTALLLDPDVFDPAVDAVLTKEELLAIRKELEDNNKGKLERGELQKEHPELYALTGG